MVQHRKPICSYLELFVGLIILGLLAIGISAGNHLLHNAKLRTVIAEVHEFKKASKLFRLEFGDLPGDITNAHDFWDDGTNKVCGTKRECNGDGNKIIEFTTSATNNESYRAWQHLTLAEIIPGNYSGVGEQADLGVNIPLSKIPLGGYLLQSIDWYQKESVGNAVLLGAVADDTVYENIISPRDAMRIDAKIDDYMPEYGLVVAMKGQSDESDHCLIGEADKRHYNINNTKVACRMAFFFR